MVEIQNGQVFSTTGKYIHRIGTESYFKRSSLLASDTVDTFEEVDSLPAFTRSEYEAKVAELVRQKYSESDEFAIQRKMINTLISPMPLSDDVDSATNEYAEYNTYVEECKIKAHNAELYKREDI